MLGTTGIIIQMVRVVVLRIMTHKNHLMMVITLVLEMLWSVQDILTQLMMVIIHIMMEMSIWVIQKNGLLRLKMER